MEIGELERRAREIRRLILKTLNTSQAGHPGGSLSAADILTALYFRVMQIDPDRPEWDDRDRFVLSKGHAAPVYYCTLARRGYFSVGELATLDLLNSRLQGHPDMRKTPGVDMSSGSLGQGISVAVGMALGAQMADRDHHVYCLLGDGECQEGQVWEAAMSAVKFGLENLTVIVDWNGLQLMAPVSEAMPLGDLEAKWRAFGWDLLVVDGHDMAALVAALESPCRPGIPRVILARTVKGKGVSFMENRVEWHSNAVSAERLARALAELEEVGA